MCAALRSMTGFGNASGPLSSRFHAHVRVTTLNARFLELALRTQPRIEVLELESAIRGVLAHALSRGRAQVTIEFVPAAEHTGMFEFRWELAERLVRALEQRPEGLELQALTLRELLALPGFAQGMGEIALDGDERAALLHLVAQARDVVATDREKEAAALHPQFEGEIADLDSFAAWLAQVNGSVQAALLTRLRERLVRALDGVAVPEERLLTEVALAADRADVSEEIQRLGAHLAHLRRLLAEGGPVGKKLEFLLQEMLREVNTAGSKCREAGMGERVVGAKAAIEKLREQFANLE